MSDTQRAGLEAALEAAGLLDAWVAPDGVLLDADTFDTLLVARTMRPASLSYWLAPVEGAAVAADVVTQILRGIACGDDDSDSAEAWIAPSGQFRIGPARGAWTKPAAEYIGFAAREAARLRRLREVAIAIDAIDMQLAEVRQQQEEVAQQQQQAIDEWEQAPADDALRAAQVDAVGFEKQRRSAAEKLAQADVRLIAAERRWRDARESLAFDAEDLRLPTAPDALAQIEHALGDFESALQSLMLEAQTVRHALPECDRQRDREAEARADVEARTENLAERQGVAAEIAARLQVLRASVGAKVEELMQRLAATRQAVIDGDKKLKAENESLRAAGEQRARSEQRVEDSGVLLEERSAARQRAVADVQAFAATGLLALALPDLEQPEQGAPWTIEAAVTLARRAEQALQDIHAEDADWSRIQNAVSTDYTELQRALSALGHQAQMDTSDYGLIVAIVYQNRPERPDLIEARITDEITQRRELLTMREREVLENHLQAEVAAAVQRLLQDSERRLANINAELPGVSICQLQRQEGIDAVYVSRWIWDGRARRAEADGARRFPALA